MANFVYPEEITFFVESIRPFQIKDVGSSKWLDVHEMVVKLSQQALLAAAEQREEEVKEMLIVRDKLKVLINEAFCIFLWKTKVLPHILEIDPNPSATFFIYTVLYHEASVISLLDMTLYHESSCESLQDSAIDLIDYCAQAVAQVIGLTSMGYHENDTNFDVDDSILTELERQKRDLIYKIGLKCVSILNYLSDHADSLPVSATRRMVATHDIPWLMVDLLSFRPWVRRRKNGIEKYIDEKWIVVEGEGLTKVVKHEAQAWFCLRQILFNTNLMKTYEINKERHKQFAKCQGLLHESLLDQLTPLIDLKHYLCQMSMAGTNSNTPKANNLILEELPEIKEKLIAETEKCGGFLRIAQLQEKLFLLDDKEKIFRLAQRINAAYNTDLLAELESKTDESERKFSDIPKKAPETCHKCANCFQEAQRKCSNCKIVYYCSRKCQLDDWTTHKQNCMQM